MAGKTIPVGTANDMIKDFNDFMTKQGVDMKKQTQSVGFTANTVMDWLNKTMAPADELKVFMGLYPPGHEQEGRTTVILWPYLKEKPLQDIDPFNEGQGLP